MKRCPQCEFVYEDDQTLCDMDGSELASAPTSSLSLLPNIMPPPPDPPVKPRRKSFVLLALAALCASVLPPAYYTYTHRRVPESTASAPKTVLPAQPHTTTEQAPSAPSPTPAPVPVQPRAAKVRAIHQAVSIARPAPTRAPTPNAKPAPQRGERQSEIKNAQPKRESGLVSILKKTGRALKKPFKF